MKVNFGFILWVLVIFSLYSVIFAIQYLQLNTGLCQSNSICTSNKDKTSGSQLK